MCINTRIACQICVWIATRIACQILKLTKQTLCLCGKSIEIQVLGGNDYEKRFLSCEFNPDTACVELRLDDGTLLAIDCTAVENEVANGMYQRSELDWLIYNNPLAYAELILNGDPELYLKAVTKKAPLD